MAYLIHGRTKEVTLNGVLHALIEAEGDGNCLFHALGHALSRLPNYGDEFLNAAANAAELRHAVVGYVRTHAKKENVLGEKMRDGMGIHRNTRKNLTVAQGLQIDQRIAYLERNGSWADEACITAVEHNISVVVRVYDEDGNETANDIPHYQSLWTNPGNKTSIAICVRYYGYRPYHYDVFIPSQIYDPERDGPPIVARPSVLSSSSSTGSKTPKSRYWLGEQKLKDLPVIDPKQFAYPPPESKSTSELLLSLGNVQQLVSVPAATVTAVRLRNAASDKSIESHSFRVSNSEKLPKSHDEPFVLKLLGARKTLDLPDFEQTYVMVETDADAKAIYLRLCHGVNEKNNPTGFVNEVTCKPADAIPEDGKKDENVEKKEDKVEKKEKNDEKGKEEEVKKKGSPYAFAAVEILTVKGTHFLDPKLSPYQLIASTAPDFPTEQSAWTWFHMPEPAMVGCPRCGALDEKVDEALRWICGLGTIRMAVYNDAGRGHCSAALTTIMSLLQMIAVRVPEGKKSLKGIDIYAGSEKSLEQIKAMLASSKDIEDVPFVIHGTDAPSDDGVFSIGAGCRTPPHLESSDVPPRNFLRTQVHLQHSPISHYEAEYIHFAKPVNKKAAWVLSHWSQLPKSNTDVYGNAVDLGLCNRHRGVELLEKGFFLSEPKEPWKIEHAAIPLMQEAMTRCNADAFAVLPIYGFGRENNLGIIAAEEKKSSEKRSEEDLQLNAADVQAGNGLANLLEALVIGVSKTARVVVLDLAPDPNAAIDAVIGRQLAQRLGDRASSVEILAHDLSYEDALKEVKAFQNSKAAVLLVHLPKVKPKPAFDYILRNSRLPPFFEGQGTKSSMIAYGRPFGHVTKSHANVQYPNAAGREGTTLQKTVNLVLTEPSASKEPLGAFLLECMQGKHDDYFRAISVDPEDGFGSKLWQGLATLEQLRTGITANPDETFK